ncbi:hypothetical protein [Floridanema aerugineum]|uniref:Uncharacterized protein n=1 Tax=Floridaenema aerugineum BLCC-F46 TaxID=3153654 RepID=A0ABV4X4Q6_9CYAN
MSIKYAPKMLLYVANLGRAIHNLGELIKIHQQIISNQMFS